MLLLLACTATDDPTDDKADDTGTDTGDVDTAESQADTSESDSGETGETEESETADTVDTGGPCPTLVSAEVRTLDHLATALAFDVTLDLEGQVRVACTTDADASEVHVKRTPLGGTTGEVGLAGLLADRDWTCDVAPVCPDGTIGEGVSLVAATSPLPRDMPRMSVTRNGTFTTDGAYTLFNWGLFCDRDETDRAVLVDPDGNVRWYWDYEEGVNIAVETAWEDDMLVTGGADGTQLPAVFVDELGRETWAAPTSRTVYHHDVKRMEDGTVLELAEATVTSSSVNFTGFQVIRQDPSDNSVVWSYHVQEAVDRHLLPVGAGDPYHANAFDWTTEPDGDKLYVSLCFANAIVKIDVATETMEWVYGDGYDFEMLDGAWPMCQHGIDVVPDSRGDEITILMFDNAYGTGASRGLELVLDETAMTATTSWEWSLEGMYSPVFGDGDYLPGGNVLLTTGGGTCVGSNIGSTATVREVERASGRVGWELDVGDDADTIYRAGRIDGCDAFDNGKYCPEVLSR